MTHRSNAVEANNSTWELLDDRSHSADEVDDLLGRAYAAAYHWARTEEGTALNQARASYLLSRAHATLAANPDRGDGHGPLALHHANQYGIHLQAAVDAGVDGVADFDHAYGHEVVARALAACGRIDEARPHYEAAAAHPIADEGDRTVVEGDLAAGPWFGLID